MKELLLFFWKKIYQIGGTVRKMMCPFITINHFGIERIFSYPHESDNTILFFMLVFVLFTLFIWSYRNAFQSIQSRRNELDILSKLLILSLSLVHENQNKSVDWYELVTNSTFSVSIASFRIFIESSLYKPIYSFLQNLKFFNLVAKKGPTRIL
jgi:NAD(P)H-quinone oxidoreductase subunit 5